MWNVIHLGYLYALPYVGVQACATVYSEWDALSTHPHKNNDINRHRVNQKYTYLIQDTGDGEVAPDGHDEIAAHGIANLGQRRLNGVQMDEGSLREGDVGLEFKARTDQDTREEEAEGEVFDEGRQLLQRHALAVLVLGMDLEQHAAFIHIGILFLFFVFAGPLLLLVELDSIADHNSITDVVGHKGELAHSNHHQHGHVQVKTEVVGDQAVYLQSRQVRHTDGEGEDGSSGEGGDQTVTHNAEQHEVIDGGPHKQPTVGEAHNDGKPMLEGHAGAVLVYHAYVSACARWGASNIVHQFVYICCTAMMATVVCNGRSLGPSVPLSLICMSKPVHIYVSEE